MDGNNWLSVVSSVVNVGFSVVVGIYLLTKAIPEMQKQHATQVEKLQAESSKREGEQRDAFLREMNTKRTDFLLELKGLGQQFKEDEKDRKAEHKESLKAMLEHCERESSRRDEMIRAELAAVSKAMQELATATEELRGAIQQRRV